MHRSLDEKGRLGFEETDEPVEAPDVDAVIYGAEAGGGSAEEEGPKEGAAEGLEVKAKERWRLL